MFVNLQLHVPPPLITELQDIQNTASRRLPYESPNSYRSLAAQKLNLYLLFFNHVYHVSLTELAQHLSVSESAIRKRVRQATTSENLVKVRDIGEFVDEPSQDDPDEFYKIRVSSTGTYYIDRRHHTGELVDHSIDPDPNLHVITSLEDFFSQELLTEFYIPDTLYDYLTYQEAK